MIPRDPRLRLAAVIVTLQVLGQAVLGFRVSIAQILVAVIAAALPELAATAWRERRLVHPASALLTGNSVGFILRVNGTHHGDWWTLRGWYWFAAASAAGILSKQLIRLHGRHLFNPSNLGLVAVLLLGGPYNVYAQYLWWGPAGPPVLAALAVILAGALWVLRPLGMWPMLAAFAMTFWSMLLLFAAGGRCFAAAWAPAGAVCGADYWTAIALSPELMVFAFFMISDPRTAPERPNARLAYGMLVGGLASALVLLQPSEYGIKVALLAALAAACSAVPFMDGRARVRLGAAALAALMVGVAAPAGAALLASDPAAAAVDGGPPPPGGRPAPHQV